MTLADIAAQNNGSSDQQQGWDAQKSAVVQQLRQAGVTAHSVDAILCVAGGWAGGNIADDLVLRTTELMLKQSVLSSVLAGHLGSLFLKPSVMPIDSRLVSLIIDFDMSNILGTASWRSPAPSRRCTAPPG